MKHDTIGIQIIVTCIIQLLLHIIIWNWNTIYSYIIVNIDILPNLNRQERVQNNTKWTSTIIPPIQVYILTKSICKEDCINNIDIFANRTKKLFLKENLQIDMFVVPTIVTDIVEEYTIDTQCNKYTNCTMNDIMPSYILIDNTINSSYINIEEKGLLLHSNDNTLKDFINIFFDTYKIILKPQLEIQNLKKDINTTTNEYIINNDILNEPLLHDIYMTKIPINIEPIQSSIIPAIWLKNFSYPYNSYSIFNLYKKNITDFCIVEPIIDNWGDIEQPIIKQQKDINIQDNIFIHNTPLQIIPLPLLKDEFLQLYNTNDTVWCKKDLIKENQRLNEEKHFLASNYDIERQIYQYITDFIPRTILYKTIEPTKSRIDILIYYVSTPIIFKNINYTNIISLKLSKDRSIIVSYNTTSSVISSTIHHQLRELQRQPLLINANEKINIKYDSNLTLFEWEIGMILNRRAKIAVLNSIITIRSLHKQLKYSPRMYTIEQQQIIQRLVNGINQNSNTISGILYINTQLVMQNQKQDISNSRLQQMHAIGIYSAYYTSLIVPLLLSIITIFKQYIKRQRTIPKLQST